MKAIGAAPSIETDGGRSRSRYFPRIDGSAPTILRTALARPWHGPGVGLSQERTFSSCMASIILPSILILPIMTAVMALVSLR